VIRYNSKVIGYVHTEIRFNKSKSGKKERLGEVTSIAVDKDFRGKKLGEKLFRFGIKRLQEKQIARIIIKHKAR